MRFEYRIGRQNAGSHTALIAVSGLALGALALAAGRQIRANLARPASRPDEARHKTPERSGKAPNITAAHGRNRASGMLAFSVLCDSALEHYRANFFNKAMYAPLATSSLSLAASLHGATDVRQESHGARHAIFAATALVGLVGGAFHLYNVMKREGGFVFQNLFYGAPIGAPDALILSGIFGVAAEWVHDAEPREPKLFGITADRILAAITSAGLFGTIGEVGLLHFRGAFQNPAMLMPVTLPPVAAVLLAKAAVEPRRRGASYLLTRAWLAATSFYAI